MLQPTCNWAASLRISAGIASETLINTERATQWAASFIGYTWADKELSSIMSIFFAVRSCVWVADSHFSSLSHLSEALQWGNMKYCCSQPLKVPIVMKHTASLYPCREWRLYLSSLTIKCAPSHTRGKQRRLSVDTILYSTWCSLPDYGWMQLSICWKFLRYRLCHKDRARIFNLNNKIKFDFKGSNYLKY